MLVEKMHRNKLCSGNLQASARLLLVLGRETDLVILVSGLW